MSIDLVKSKLKWDTFFKDKSHYKRYDLLFGRFVVGGYTMLDSANLKMKGIDKKLVFRGWLSTASLVLGKYVEPPETYLTTEEEIKTWIENKAIEEICSILDIPFKIVKPRMPRGKVNK